MITLYIGNSLSSTAKLLTKAKEIFPNELRIYFEEDLNKAFELICSADKIEAVFVELKNIKSKFDAMKEFRIKVGKYRKKIIFYGLTNNKADCYEAIKLQFNDVLLEPLNQEIINKTIMDFRKNFPQNNVFIQTMPTFTLRINDNIVQIKNSKAKEILAYLINAEGRTVTNTELINEIWPGSLTDDNTLNRCRVAICNLKKFLKDNNIREILNMTGRERYINKDKFSCDFYELLDGNMMYIQKFDGRYLEEYSWAEPTKGFITNMLINRGLYNPPDE